jgi:transcriptional regulator with XRE-family HTH domain
MEFDYMHLIKTVRKEKDIGQKQIADALHIKQTQYSRYERKINKMPYDYFLKACKYLNISVDNLIDSIDLK